MGKFYLKGNMVYLHLKNKYLHLVTQDHWKWTSKYFLLLTAVSKAHSAICC